jgi:hypothetical protein
MLELDYLHRAQSPLEPRMRGQMRWVAAHANGCRYAEAQAAADLRRAGETESAIQELAGDWSSLPADTRTALDFAAKLSRDGSSVTDDEMERLIARHGEPKVVAMALLLAYASFQDRLILALGISPEPDEPLAPCEVRFAPRPLGASRAASPRKGPQGAPVAPPAIDPLGPTGNFPGLQERLAAQRERRCRIALPPADSDVPRWGLVCKTYQPRLANAWAACAHAFSDEANQDPVFEQNVFWVVTDATRCFY